MSYHHKRNLDLIFKATQEPPTHICHYRLVLILTCTVIAVQVKLTAMECRLKVSMQHGYNTVRIMIQLVIDANRLPLMKQMMDLLFGCFVDDTEIVHTEHDLIVNRSRLTGMMRKHKLLRKTEGQMGEMWIGRVPEKSIRCVVDNFDIVFTFLLLRLRDFAELQWL